MASVTMRIGRFGSLELYLVEPRESHRYLHHAVCRKRKGFALRFLQRLKTRQSAIRHMRDFVRRRASGPNLADWNDEQILELVAKWISNGEAILGYQRRLRSGGTSEEVQEAAPTVRSEKLARQPREIKTWIEIRLVDEEEKPVPHQKYRIKLTDGSVQEGTLDADGRARFNQIDPGTCEVSFPNIDAPEWRLS